MQLAGSREADGDRLALATAFRRESAQVERAWRKHLEHFTAAD